MPMLQGSKEGRSLLGKSIRPRFTPTPKSPQAAGAARRSCRHGPAVTPGSRRERAVAAGRAPQPPKAAGAKRRGRRDQSPQRPRAPTSAQRPQPTMAPSQAACSSVTVGGGRAQFSEHSADQCGALSAAPKEQDKAPHMVEDVLKTEPDPRRTGHTTRRAA